MKTPSWHSTAWQLASDSPFVVASRMARLASTPSADTVLESVRMIAEKQEAMTESYLAMLTETNRYLFDAYMSGWKALMTGTAPRHPWTERRTDAFLNKALKPYQKRARANARRLK